MAIKRILDVRTDLGKKKKKLVSAHRKIKNKKDKRQSNVTGKMGEMNA